MKNIEIPQEETHRYGSKETSKVKDLKTQKTNLRLPKGTAGQVEGGRDKLGVWD